MHSKMNLSPGKNSHMSSGARHSLLQTPNNEISEKSTPVEAYNDLS